MGSTFGGLEIGKKSLIAHQVALDVTGHNIANANTEGYSRQKVNMQPDNPQYYPGFNAPAAAGQIGTGVMVESIERIRNSFIDFRINSEKQSQGKWDTLFDKLHQIELIYNEPSDNGIRNVFNEFWSSFEELANDPTSYEIRSVVRERALALTDIIKSTYNQLNDLKNSVNTDISTMVSQINDLSDQISSLNLQIRSAEVKGDNANDLLDKRDSLVEELSSIINVQVSSDDPDDYRVSAGGLVLVQGIQKFHLNAEEDPANGNMLKIFWENTDNELLITNGELKGLLDIRDEVLTKHLDYMDDMAIALSDRFNEMHRNGFGLNNTTGVDFFSELQTGANTSLYKITGDSFVFNTKNALNDSSNFSGAVEDGYFVINDVAISYDADTDSLDDIVDRINSSGAGVTARVSPTNKLVISADQESGYVITGLSNGASGNLLDILGILTPGTSYPPSGSLAGEYLKTPEKGFASKIGISSSIETDLAKIAAAGGEDIDLDGVPDERTAIGDGNNALAIANLKNEGMFEKDTSTFEQFINGIISDLATETQVAKSTSEGQALLVDNLANLRTSVSGVSLDEEMVNMMKFQYGYQAAAKVITTMTEMLDNLIALGR